MAKSTRGLRPVLLAWLFITTLTTTLYLRAAVEPPPGHAFLGFFLATRDAYHYLFYVQQAEQGAFLMHNKLLLEDHAPALVNLEWWTVGRLSALLGGHPLVAYRLFGIAAALALLLAVDRWLLRAGLPEDRRLPSLLLVSTAGGFGGLLFALGRRPFYASLDIATGLFPFMELVANPHFVIGTALLLWSLWYFQHAERPRDLLLAVGLASILGLARPYDFALVPAIHGLATLVTQPAQTWLRRLLPLVGLAPVAGYNYWLFIANPAYAFYTTTGWFPEASDFAWALGPALVGAATVFGAAIQRPEERTARIALAVWVACCGAIASFKPVSFSLQFLAGIGVPILALAAVGLARFRPRVTLAAALVLGGSSLVVLRLLMTPHPIWHVPGERFRAGEAFRAVCAPGDLALSPADIGLYLSAFSNCRGYVSHEVAPDFDRRVSEVVGFYEGAPAQRAALLDRLCVKHFVLPWDAGEVPEAALGAPTAFRRFALLGRPPQILSLYTRPLSGCRQTLR